MESARGTITRQRSWLALAAVVAAYASPLLFFDREQYWHYLWLPPYAAHGVIVVPLVLAGTFVAVRGLMRGRRTGAPGDDLWYVAAALLGVPYVLMLLLHGLILLSFVLRCAIASCPLVL